MVGEGRGRCRQRLMCDARRGMGWQGEGAVAAQWAKGRQSALTQGCRGAKGYPERCLFDAPPVL